MYSALRTLQQSHPDLTITKSQSFFKMKGTLSGGTVATMYTLLDIPWSERRSDEWQLVTSYRSSLPYSPPTEMLRRMLTLASLGQPSSRPKTIYEAVIDGVHRYGGFFFMYPYNRLIVRRSWFLSGIDTSLFPRPSAPEQGSRYALRNKGKGRSSSDQKESGGDKEPVHGDELQYEEAVIMPSKVWAWLFSFLNFSFFALFFTSSIVSSSPAHHYLRLGIR